MDGDYEIGFDLHEEEDVEEFQEDPNLLEEEEGEEEEVEDDEEEEIEDQENAEGGDEVEGLDQIEDLFSASTVSSVSSTSSSSSTNIYKKPLEKRVPIVEDSDTRKILKSHFVRHGWVRHQLESVNKFMSTSIPEIMQEYSSLSLDSEKTQRRHTFQLSNMTVTLPSIKESDGTIRSVMPNECRLRGLTYASRILVDVVHDVHELIADPVTGTLVAGQLLEAKTHKEKSTMQNSNHGWF
jgi:hypothetical protein